MKTDIMRMTLKRMAMLTFLMSAWSLAYAQKETEMYVPIGKSPGLSGKYTLIGNVAAVDAKLKTLTLTNATGSQTVKLTGGTRIWLDKSQLKSANQTGALTDCQKGRLVEVKFVNNDRNEGSGEWIKVGVGGSGSGTQTP
jgi:hypothetical protein